jgi:hypothetical protein
VQLGEPMQLIDGRLRRRHDVDATEEKHQGKNGEPENNFFLHYSIYQPISGYSHRS